jgi:hypothetical protein
VRLNYAGPALHPYAALEIKAGLVTLRTKLVDLTPQITELLAHSLARAPKGGSPLDSGWTKAGDLRQIRERHRPFLPHVAIKLATYCARTRPERPAGAWRTSWRLTRELSLLTRLAEPAAHADAVVGTSSLRGKHLTSELVLLSVDIGFRKVLVLRNHHLMKTGHAVSSLLVADLAGI